MGEKDGTIPMHLKGIDRIADFFRTRTPRIEARRHTTSKRIEFFFGCINTWYINQINNHGKKTNEKIIAYK